MTRIVDNNNYVAFEVLDGSNNPIPGAVVTPSAPVYSDAELTAQVTTVTAGSDGAVRFHASPGTYTFTTTATGAAAIEPVEVRTPGLGATTPEQAGRHLTHSGTAPTAAAGANAGTSPPAPVVTAGSDDTRGNVTFGTGTTPAAGAQVVVTFASAYTTAPFVQLTAGNAGTAALTLAVTAVSTTAFTVTSNAVPAGSQANTVFSVNYQAIG